MKGFPKIFNTKEDYLCACQMAQNGELSKVRVISQLNNLVNTEKVYVFDRILGELESPDGPEPQYRVVEQDNDGVPEKHQFIQQVDTDSRLLKTGFTVAECQQLITDLEGV